MDRVLMTLRYLSGSFVSSVMLMHKLWILNVKFYNSSLSFIIILVSFLYREPNPEKMEKLAKRMVTVSLSFSTPPRRICIVPEVPPSFETSSREMSLSFENHQVEISLENSRSISFPGASSAPLTED